MKNSDIYKIIFVSYGLDNFDKGLFKEPTFDMDINKPRGGFWGSPINSDSSWGEWCKNNEFNIKSLDKHILFKVKKGSKICIIDNERDLNGHSRNIPRYYYRRDDMINDLKSRYPNAHRYEIEKAVDDYLSRDSKSVLDFDFLKRNYDGIFVSASAVHKLRHVSNGDGLYWWDVESICIFNPDAIEIIPENAFEKAKVPSYEDGDGFISDDEYKKSKENRHHGYDDNYDDIRMDYKRKQINKAYELYGNRNIDSDSSKLFNGEHPGILAQGHGNNKNTKLAKKYNGTIKSGLDESKKGRKNTINMVKVQISEDDIRYIVNECIGKILLREIRRMTDYFIVEKMLKEPVSINMGQITKHFNDRGDRVKKINRKITDFGAPVYSFIVNCGHINGKEIHTITEKGIIIIQNAISKNIITILIARPGQITRYWEGLKQELPQDDERFSFIMRYCKLNQELGHNNF